MGVHWIVQEGYLRFKLEGSNSAAAASVLHRVALVERYVVLYMNRKMEMFETNAKDPAQRVDACYLRAFCGWDGEGLLKAGEAYGLELKLEKHAQSRLCVAAFNRLDLEKWCRGFLAVLDPESAAGQEVRRERRKARKEEKRAQEEKEEKIRLWKEQQRKMREDEIFRLQQREEEIQNMTPLERVDGLGSLDDETARILEKRRQRLQRRQAPTTRRVNKAAYRQRLEDAAGGKLENVQPLQTKIVQEQRGKVRVEAPAPGQYIEVSGAAVARRSSNPARRRRLDSTDGSGSDSDISSRDSRMSSGPFSAGSMSGSIPPPPPPRSEFDDSRSDFIPPPPPIPGSRRDSRSQSLRGSFYGEVERQSELSSSRISISHSSRHLSGADREKQNVQASLAAILSGRSVASRGDDRRNRHNSFESTADSTANGDSGSGSRTKKMNGATGESPVTNAFAASLAAIRRNRADTMDEISNVDVPPPRKRDRKRDSQLSAEGKAILQKAISMDGPSAPVRKQDAVKSGRKGLFDDSSSEDDSDAGLFGMRKSSATNGRERPSEGNERPSTTAARRGVDTRYTESAISDDYDDRSDGLKQSAPSDYTSPRSASSPVSVSRGNFYSQPKNLDVVYKSCVLQNQGKKASAVYSFAFRSGNAEHSFSRSYHEFDDIHKRLKSETLPSLPKFPSKHLTRNNTKPENMQKRAMEFVQYFQELVAIPGILNNKRFQFEFEISDDFVRTVLGTGSATAPSQLTPPPLRTPKPSRGANATVSNVGKSRATALFGAADTDSDAESVSAPMPTPKKPIQTPAQPAPEVEPKKKKKSKPSRKDFDDDAEPLPTSSRRDRTRSRNSVKSVVDAKPAEPQAPKITGLPARPNLFGGGRGDLLAAIRQGAALKKVDGEDALLAPAGRDAGFPAPSSAPLPPPPPPLTNAGSVAEAISNAMAARRIHVEYEDKSDSDSDDDWD